MALWVIAYGGVQSAVARAAGEGDARPSAGSGAGERPRARPGRRHGADPDRVASELSAGGDDARWAGALRDRVRAELVGALVSGARVFRSRSRVAERGLLLHGERLRASARHAAVRRAVSAGRRRGVAVGRGGARRRRRHRCACFCRRSPPRRSRGRARRATTKARASGGRRISTADRPSRSRSRRSGRRRRSPWCLRCGWRETWAACSAGTRTWAS